MVTCAQELYNTWLPFIGDSRTLSAPSRCWRFAWVKLKSPAPVLINHRDACLSCKAYDGLDEDGRILILITSHTNRPEDGKELDCPDGGPRTVRVNVKRAAVSLVPLVNGGTRIAAMAHIDPLLYLGLAKVTSLSCSSFLAFQKNPSAVNTIIVRNTRTNTTAASLFSLSYLSTYFDEPIIFADVVPLFNPMLILFLSKSKPT